ncbi:MAG: hypothetical protein ACE5GC_07645 [Acidimicrobiia bacterium]
MPRFPDPRQLTASGCGAVAIAERFGDEVEYVEDERTADRGTFAEGATYLNPGTVYGMAGGVVVDVWVMRGPLNGLRRTYLFTRSGSGWAEVSPREAGVTVTTAV